MDTVKKKETFVTTQPDGTIVRTTTTTRTTQDTEYEYTSTALNVDYCCTWAAFLRILQIICGFIVVGCVSAAYGTHPLRGVLSGQVFVLVAVSVCICITFTLLVVLFLGLHTSFLDALPWRPIDLVYSIIACILFIVCGGLEVWYSTGTWRGDCDQVNAVGLYGEQCRGVTVWAVAAAFCFIGAILYAIGAWLASKRRYFR